MFFAGVEAGRWPACFFRSDFSNSLHRFFRQRVVRPLHVPQNTEYPPPFPIIEQLNTVDPSLERLRAWRMPRFVTAEHLRDIPIALHSVHNRVLIKGLALEIVPRQLDK